MATKEKSKENVARPDDKGDVRPDPLDAAESTGKTDEDIRGGSSDLGPDIGESDFPGRSGEVY